MHSRVVGTRQLVVAPGDLVRMNGWSPHRAWPKSVALSMNPPSPYRPKANAQELSLALVLRAIGIRRGTPLREGVSNLVSQFGDTDGCLVW
jgi:hypothetical protein